MKVCRMCIVLCLMGLLSGCATGTAPYSAVRSRALNSDRVIYFEQSDRLPKSVLEAAIDPKHEAEVFQMAGISPDIIGRIIAEALRLAPDLAKSYSGERMANAMYGRRFLFVGYSGDELPEITKMIEAMGRSVERITPDDQAAGKD